MAQEGRSQAAGKRTHGMMRNPGAEGIFLARAGDGLDEGLSKMTLNDKRSILQCYELDGPELGIWIAIRSAFRLGYRLQETLRVSLEARKSSDVKHQRGGDQIRA